MNVTKIIVKIITTIIVLILAQNSVKSQSGFEPVSASFKIFPKYDSDSPTITQFKSSLSWPVLIREKYSVLLAGSYENNRYKELGFPLQNRTVQSVSGQIILNKPLSQTKNFTAILNAGINSDFEDISSEDFNYSLFGLWSKFSNTSFSYSYGFAYTRQFYGHSIFPFFGFSKQLGDKLVLNFMNPIGPVILYKFSDMVTYGFQGNYSSGDSRLSELQDSRIFVDRKGDISFFTDIGVTKALVLNVTTGYSFLRNIRVFEDVENSSSKWFNLKVDNNPIFEKESKGMFFEVGLKLRFSGNK